MWRLGSHGSSLHHLGELSPLPRFDLVLKLKGRRFLAVGLGGASPYVHGLSREGFLMLGVTQLHRYTAAYQYELYCVYETIDPNHALSYSDKRSRLATRHRLVVTGTPTEAGAFGHVENLQARSYHGDSLDDQQPT